LRNSRRLSAPSDFELPAMVYLLETRASDLLTGKRPGSYVDLNGRGSHWHARCGVAPPSIPLNRGIAVTKSNLLRVHEVRDAYRLIGECRDVGSNPALWHRRMFEGLSRLIGAPAVSGGEGKWFRLHRAVEAVSAFGIGFDAHASAVYRAYMRDVTPGRDPVFRALQEITGPLVTLTRRPLVSDAQWYRSIVWNDYHRPVGIDDRLTSVYHSGDAGAVSVIALHRGVGEREFSQREQRLMRFSTESSGG